MSEILSWASRFERFPIFGKSLGQKESASSLADATQYKNLQQLCFRCATEIAQLIRPGWTEIKTANLMETWLRDHGVKVFFHKPFVWWGDRTRFQGVKTYWDYLPTQRAVREGDVFILDVAPIRDGFVSDIGFSGRLGENKDYDRALADLTQLRTMIPEWLTSSFEKRLSFWHDIDSEVKRRGYENIHAKYPFGVLGHRLRRINVGLEFSFIHFGWQSYWDYLSRGLFGQILNQDFKGSMEGLWAIEPHIGTSDFGIKFEEILCVEKDRAYWLDSDSHFHLEIER